MGAVNSNGSSAAPVGDLDARGVDAGEDLLGDPGSGEEFAPLEAEDAEEGRDFQAGQAPTEDVDRQEEARRRVKGMSEDALAETYAIAVKTQEEASTGGKTDQAQYWEALRQATVEEAARRPRFDAAEARKAGKGAWRKRQVVKRLKRLSAAREELLHSRGS